MGQDCFPHSGAGRQQWARGLGPEAIAREITNMGNMQGLCVFNYINGLPLAIYQSRPQRAFHVVSESPPDRWPHNCD